MQGDDPPYLSVGTEVSAKYKGAFCEAKIRKVVRSVKCRVTYKQGLGTATVTDDQIKGTLRIGASVEARHADKKDFIEATITKIQDCSQYTVVFDDGDITTLRRTALCLKSGRHFAESETLDQLPLTHPEHFGNPVIGGRRGRRSRQAQDDSSEDEESPPRGSPSGSGGCRKEGGETEPEIGRVVCVELGDKKKKDNWFPGLVVAPTAQDTVRIRVRDDYLVRSFKDARYYTVPKKEATEFTKEMGVKIDNTGLKVAVEKALLFLEKNELPPHWDKDSLFGNAMSSGNSDSDADLDSDSSDDEPREEKDHFVAQLYKFMDDRGTPINNCPMIGTEDIDLYRLFRAVYKLGGYNRVTNQNQWKSISRRLGLSMQPTQTMHTLVKQAYKKFLHSFEDFYRKLGCTMVNHPRGSTRKQRPGRSLIRDKDRNTPVPTPSQMIKQDKEKTENDDDKKLNNVDEEKKQEQSTPGPSSSSSSAVSSAAAATAITTTTTTPVAPSPLIPTPAPVQVAVSVPAAITPTRTATPPVPPPPPASVSATVATAATVSSSVIPTRDTKEEEVVAKAPLKNKKESPEESVSGQESDVNVEGESTESSSSEKSQKPPARFTPLPSSRSKPTIKNKDEPKKKLHEKRKPEGNTSSSSSSSSSSSGIVTALTGTKKDLSKRDEEATKTRSKSKDDTKGKESRETRTPSRESDKIRGNPSKPRRLTEDELKKQQRGRKKRDDTEKSRSEKDENSGTESSAPCYKGPIQFGDRLKVYYGPTHDSKVTYEAKVIGMQRVEGGELDYLVHYTGWNTRYDEWIKATRIAQNFTQTQGRVKRTKATPRPQTPSTSSKSSRTTNSSAQSRRRAQSVAPSTSKNSSSNLLSSTLPINNKDKDGNSQPARSTTPLSVASSSSRTKSPATPASSRPTRNAARNAEHMGIELRRRTRRMSGHTDLSVATESEDSDAYETDTTEPDRARTRSRGTEERRRREVRRRVEDRIKPDENSENEDEKDEKEVIPRRTRRLRRTVTKLQEVKSEAESGGNADLFNDETDENDEDENDDEDEAEEDEPAAKPIVNERPHDDPPKGRDFDLNQIRSELKGFDKAVKSEVLRIEPENSGDEDTKPKVEEFQKEVKEEKKEIKIEEIVKEIKIEPKTVIESVPVKLAPPSPLPAPEDVYEFKEPEPFEFEVRNKRDSGGDKDKSAPKKRVFDEEPKSPKKKQKTTAAVQSPKEMKIDPPSTPPTSSVTAPSNEIETKRKARRILVKRSEENTDNHIVKPTTQPLTSMKDFERINEPVQISTIKSIPPSPVTSIPNEEQSTTKATASLNVLFHDLPNNEDNNADVDDSEDRLIISETNVSETEPANLFTYQQEIFPSSSKEIPEKKMELSKKEEKLVELKKVKEEKLPVVSTSINIIPTISTIVTTSNLRVAPSIERKMLEAKAPSVISMTSGPIVAHSSPMVPAPISTRLPATSTIEEKLSAAAHAFRQSKSKDFKRDDDSTDSKRGIKENSKKLEALTKRTKLIEDLRRMDLEKKKDQEEAAALKQQEEERNRELLRVAIKQKEEELEQLKNKKELELKKAAEAKVDNKRIPEKQRDDDWKKKDRNEPEIDPLREVVEAKESERKRKKVLSQEFVDSSDSSDSEQKLVIDNSEVRDEKLDKFDKHERNVASSFEVKIKAELDMIQESHQDNQVSVLVDSKSSQIGIKTEEEGENMNLLCEEEIPGSPAPIIDTTEQDGVGDRSSRKDETNETKLVLLEMTFASAPSLKTPVTGPSSSLAMVVSCSASVPMPMEPSVISGPRHIPQQPIPAPVAVQPSPSRRESNEAAPVMDNTPPTTPDSTISNISGSPRDEERIGGSPLSDDNVKINRDSSEADNDSAGGKALSGYSEDDAMLNTEASAMERSSKATKRPVEESTLPKKRKRNRKNSECGSNAGKKQSIRQSTRQTRQGANAGSDSDDTSESSNPIINNSATIITPETNINGITELNNSALRSSKPTKYNFYVELDPDLDGSQRISVLQQKLTDLKKTYNSVKVELAAIERRRKKLRRREREAMKAAKAEMQQACS